MDRLLDNFNLVYLIVLGLLLFTSWYFFQKAQYDERRKNRSGLKSFKRNIQVYRKKMVNEDYDIFFRQNGLPHWITSERLNLLRFSVAVIIVIILGYEILTGQDVLTVTDLMMWVLVPIALTPKKPFPMYYVVIMFQRKHQNDVSNEIYQLYNDLKSSFQIQGTNKSSYYLIQSLLPYYSVLRPSMEKMLPYLEVKNNEEAWRQFALGLHTKEADTLGVVMKEVESIKQEQALLLLEQKRDEFSNDLYNRYTDGLRRKKSLIFILVVVGALTVFLNEVTVFFIWYKEVMSVVNQAS